MKRNIRPAKSSHNSATGKGAEVPIMGDERPEILRLISRPSRPRKTPLDPSCN